MRRHETSNKYTYAFSRCMNALAVPCNAAINGNRKRNCHKRQVCGLPNDSSDGSAMTDNRENSDRNDDSHFSGSTSGWLSSDSLSEGEGQRRRLYVVVHQYEETDPPLGTIQLSRN